MRWRLCSALPSGFEGLIPRAAALSFLAFSLKVSHHPAPHTYPHFPPPPPPTTSSRLPVIGECRVKGPHPSPQFRTTPRSRCSCSAPCGLGRGLAVTTSQPSSLCPILLLSLPPQVSIPGALPSKFPARLPSVSESAFQRTRPSVAFKFLSIS